MKKTLALFSFLLLLSGCSNEKVETASTETSSFSLVPNEIIPDEYENEVDWSILMREPDKYLSLQVQALGDVVQVIEDYEDNYNLYLLNEVRDGVGNTRNYFFAYLEKERLGKKILKGDRIQVYGNFAGDHTYNTAGGSTDTLPLVYLHDYQIFFNKQ